MNKIKLKIKWSEESQDFIIHHPTNADGHWAHRMFMSDRTELRLLTTNDAPLRPGEKCDQDGMQWKWNDPSPHFQNRIYREISHSLVDQLIDRGFDPKTLKIEVSIDPTKLESQFPHIYETLTDEEKAKLDIA